MAETNENTVSSNINTNEDTQNGKYLTFIVGDEFYGIEIKHVTEIIGIQDITEVPGVPDYVKGIINLRGKIIPVIEVRTRFRKESIEYNDRTCIIVIDIEEVSIGLIIDSVSEVLSIDEADIVPPPDTKTGFQNYYVKGIGKVGEEVKLLLDCARLIGVGEYDGDGIDGADNTNTSMGANAI